MKKKILLLIIGVSALLFQGCSNSLYDEHYGSDVRMFVDPNATGILDSDIIPSSNAESNVPLENGSSGAASTTTSDNSEGVELGQQIPTTPGIHDVTTNVISGIFYGNGFNFLVPPELRNNITVMLTNEIRETENIAHYDIYYVQEDGVRAEVLSIIVARKTYYLKADGFEDTVKYGESSDETYVFLLNEDMAPLPTDFTDTTAYLNVYQAVATSQSITVY